MESKKVTKTFLSCLKGLKLNLCSSNPNSSSDYQVMEYKRCESAAANNTAEHPTVSLSPRSLEHSEMQFYSMLDQSSVGALPTTPTQHLPSRSHLGARCAARSNLGPLFSTSDALASTHSTDASLSLSRFPLLCTSPALDMPRRGHKATSTFISHPSASAHVDSQNSSGSICDGSAPYVAAAHQVLSPTLSQIAPVAQRRQVGLYAPKFDSVSTANLTRDESHGDWQPSGRFSAVASSDECLSVYGSVASSCRRSQPSELSSGASVASFRSCAETRYGDSQCFDTYQSSLQCKSDDFHSVRGSFFDAHSDQSQASAAVAMGASSEHTAALEHDDNSDDTDDVFVCTIAVQSTDSSVLTLAVNERVRLIHDLNCELLVHSIATGKCGYVAREFVIPLRTLLCALNA